MMILTFWLFQNCSLASGCSLAIAAKEVNKGVQFVLVMVLNMEQFSFLHREMVPYTIYS